MKTINPEDIQNNEATCPNCGQAIEVTGDEIIECDCGEELFFDGI